MAAPSTKTAALAASTPPANSKRESPALTLATLPLEIRHMIFVRACVREGILTKHIMRRWFEVKDVKEQIAKGAKGVTKFGSNVFEPDSEDGLGEADEDEDDDDEEDEDDGGEEDEDDEEDGDDEDSGEDEDDDEGEGEGEDEDGEFDEEEEEEEEAYARAQAAAAAQQLTIRPATKWRHVSKFLRITQAPPSVDLFLVGKALGSEVKAWFYDTAVLKVDATASFAHSSFFEMVLEDLASATYTPMTNIKKAEVTFVWDTTWVRAQEKLPNNEYGVVFPVLLDSRSNFVLEILLRAPELAQLVIHWHDSENDDGSQILMNQICMKFAMMLDADVKIEQHLIANDIKPNSRSAMGKRRIEFQNIVDMRRDVF